MLDFGQTGRLTIAQHLDVFLKEKRIRDLPDEFYPRMRKGIEV